MLFSRHSEHFRELEEHQRHFQTLQERMRENSILGPYNTETAADTSGRDSASSSSLSPSSSAQATPSLPRHAQGGSTAEENDRQHHQEASAEEQREQVDEAGDGIRGANNLQTTAAEATSASSTHVTPTLPRHAPDGSTTETDEERLQRLERRRQQEMRETEERLHHRLHDDEPPDPRPRKQRMSIGQLAREESIDDLNIKQLKEILVTNFVDYKGCVEKQELIARVKRLWNQKAARSSAGNPPNESDECRICMDATIDCVLLECGHMVTCTSCGRRLAECPICRQYVSRVVHTFKA